MNLHANARTTPHSRKLLVKRVLREGWSVTEAAFSAGIHRATAYKWIGRFKSEGDRGLHDRSSAPKRVWNRTCGRIVRRIRKLRLRRLTGDVIAQLLSMARSTVGGILRRLGMGRLRALEPKEPVVRYERARPGELLHIDIKKLSAFWRPGKRTRAKRNRGKARNKGAGWDFVYVCVDDRTRVAYMEILADEKAPSAVGFLRRAKSWYESLGVHVERVMTDNGACFISRAWRELCAELEVRHLRTRPYRPETNGKAERLIQTLQREWAYACEYPSAAARATALGPWLEHYNLRRPHRGIGGQTPFERLRGDL